MEILTQIITPDLAISLISLAFGIWVTWSKLNSRIEELEVFKREANIAEINIKLAELNVKMDTTQKDIERIKANFSKLQDLLSKKK